MRREVMTCDNCGVNREPPATGQVPHQGYILDYPTEFRGPHEVFEFCSLACVGEFVHPAAIDAREKKRRDSEEAMERFFQHPTSPRA